jgi:hypothetical protein
MLVTKKKAPLQVTGLRMSLQLVSSHCFGLPYLTKMCKKVCVWMSICMLRIILQLPPFPLHQSPLPPFYNSLLQLCPLLPFIPLYRLSTPFSAFLVYASSVVPILLLSLPISSPAFQIVVIVLSPPLIWRPFPSSSFLLSFHFVFCLILFSSSSFIGNQFRLLIVCDGDAKEHHRRRAETTVTRFGHTDIMGETRWSRKVVKWVQQEKGKRAGETIWGEQRKQGT